MVEISLKEITKKRTNENCYLIESEAEDFSFIHGSYYRESTLDELYDTAILYMQEKVKWESLENKIKWDRDEVDLKRQKSLWVYKKDIDDKLINVKNLVIDGEKQVIE